ncbi:hypothetical protein Tco_1419287 [Tanacetum coccineum]
MASSITRFDIKKLDGNIVQNYGGSKQVGLRQLGSKQVGFKQLGHKKIRELKGIMKLRIFGLVTTMLQGSKTVEDKKLEERTNTDCLVKEQEKAHLDIKVRADTVDRNNA